MGFEDKAIVGIYSIKLTLIIMILWLNQKFYSESSANGKVDGVTTKMTKVAKPIWG